MEPTSRLYQCLFCHAQTVVCSKCDHGQIYCSKVCSKIARYKSLKLAGIRYQATFSGKRHHAARQASYRKRQNKIVTHLGSPQTPQRASIQLFENNPKKTENRQLGSPPICCFCKKPVSYWLRNHFLRRRGHQKQIGLRAIPQAP